MPYDWGPSGSKALIPSLLGATGLSSVPAEPAAELWMGAHPRSPALLKIEGKQNKKLDQWITLMPQHFLGPTLTKAGFRKLPFLFKIIEAQRPLSLQMHPNRSAAKKLHHAEPRLYPDPNHKPELALCLQGMQALKGFRSERELRSLWKRVPELQVFCRQGPPKSSPSPLRSSYSFTNWLKQLFCGLMYAKKELIQEAAKKRRIKLQQSTGYSNTKLPREDALFLQLADQFGLQDAGLFCSYLLNYIALKPGETIFLQPGEVHCYLQGAILECTAASDNVIRAGLTKKHKDIKKLTEMLSYHTAKATIHRAVKKGPLQIYRPSVAEFELSQLDLPSKESSKWQKRVILPQLDSPSILLIYSGHLQLEFYQHNRLLEQREFQRGTILFLPGDLAWRNIQLRLSSTIKSRIYRSRVPLPLPPGAALYR